MEKAYVLLSGGQDSFVCLLWAMEKFDEVEAVSIHYGQKHKTELHYAEKIAGHFKIRHTVYDIDRFISSMAESSLLQQGNHNEHHPQASNLPASFVPNRNGIFLTVVSNHAFRQNDKRINIVIGTCETDFSGYPDCRDAYIKAKALELSLGLDRPVNIYTPLMWKNKAETFEMADHYGKFQELIDLTMTCYNADENLNPWGHGCGQCPACTLRKKGYEDYLMLKK